MSLFDQLRRLFGGRVEEMSAPVGTEMISCEEALTAVYEYLDGELDEASAAQVQAHFEACARCYPHLRLEESFRGAVRRAADAESVPEDLKDRLIQVLADSNGEGA